MTRPCDPLTAAYHQHVADARLYEGWQYYLSLLGRAGSLEAARG